MSEKYLPIITRQKSTQVAVSDVISIERYARKLVVNSEDDTYVYYEKIDNAEKYLDKRFCRVLDSCIINMEKVKSMEDHTIYFRNGDTMKVGKNSYGKARKRFNQYIREKSNLEDQDPDAESEVT